MTRRKMRGGHQNMRLYNLLDENEKKDEKIYHTFTVLQNQFDNLTKEFNKVDFILKSFIKKNGIQTDIPGSYFKLGTNNIKTT
jgi:hypothetical protein